MSNGSKALGRSDPVGYSGVAADKNVRAPVASPKSSRFAQTFAYSNPARRRTTLIAPRRAGNRRALLPTFTDRLQSPNPKQITNSGQKYLNVGLPTDSLAHPLRACLKNHGHCRKRREEAQIS